MDDIHHIRLGYACINTNLREYNVFTSRSLILKTANEKGLSYIEDLINDNLDDLMKILIFNEAKGIRFFRITSCLFPHLDNPKFLQGNYDISFVKDKMKVIGKYAKQNGHRLTFHPGQFNQLGSPNVDVVNQTILDLTNHVKVFEMMGLEPEDGSVLIVHGGGVYGDKEKALERWKDTFYKIPLNVRKYISLENDENSYSIDDLLPFCEKLNIPFCLDFFHNEVSRDRIDITPDILKRTFRTWHHRNMIPKIHISEQQIGLKRGAHSKTIDSIPKHILQIPKIYQTSLDIMLEVKDKEVSVFKIYYKYFDLLVDQQGRIEYMIKSKYI